MRPFWASSRERQNRRQFKEHLIGIDWGDTKIEGVAMQPDGVELLRLRRPTPRHDYPGCIDVIAALIAELEEKTGKQGTICIGIPGSLEPVSRLGKGASSIWLLGRPVERDLKEAIQREIRVENDADCFAASEAVDGAGAGHNVVFAVILGSGAGAGIAVGGRAHHGPNNSSGEWGHNPLPFPDSTEITGKPCYCGRHGCMETWVSGRAFEAQYTEHTGAESSSTSILGIAWAPSQSFRRPACRPTTSSPATACAKATLSSQASRRSMLS